ncbi:LysE/ArgO family amino acid transporter [Demequina mangrovi]|uniref:L-lysine exporter family protein LysE/ArgO n=1 Tax=Demequina mangrovi TaxID=1043493 RepID=A0A1H6WMM6_9MICO|nr:LysE family transporter [Demequina mangrovi]SEJ17016.1 L-lysine exporter family protein LysE/ArgO [Demequina mangrovi]
MTYLVGLGLGLSLIVAIGAQNVFVLRQGLRREHVLLVVTICTLSDAVLIAAGVAGVGAAVENVPWLVSGARWAGAAFLLGYAALAARRALRPAGETLDAHDAPAAAASSGAVAATCLALTWLNPHVYLDTVVLLGTVASTHEARWLFAAGAVTGSALWFAGLGFGARLLSGVLARPGAWRVLDGAIAAVMAVLAVSLVAGA